MLSLSISLNLLWSVNQFLQLRFTLIQYKLGTPKAAAEVEPCKVGRSKLSSYIND